MSQFTKIPRLIKEHSTRIKWAAATILFLITLAPTCGCRSSAKLMDTLEFNKEIFISQAETNLSAPEFGQAWVIPDLKMVLEPIAPAKIIMGSMDPTNDNATPWHYVELTKPFWMGRFEVTQIEYTRIMEKNPSIFVGDYRPVDNVTWYDAMRFCAILTVLEHRAGRIPDGYIYRLPTESEWEYCCRGGIGGEFDDNLDLFAWYVMNSDGKTHTVGLKQANGYNLYDTLGNVTEWCFDRGARYTSNSKTDPRGPSIGIFRIVRGGSWYNSNGFCTYTYRYFINPNNANYYTGFRVVLAPGVFKDLETGD